MRAVPPCRSPFSKSDRVGKLIPLSTSSRKPLSVWCHKLPFHDAICVQPVKTLRSPQPYGEQTTGPLKRICVSILALDPRLLVQYKLVTSLERTTGGDQRFAHICNLPRGVHVASSASLDSKAPLPIVLDVRPVCSFELPIVLDVRPVCSFETVERRRSSEASTPSLQELCRFTIDFM